MARRFLLLFFGVLVLLNGMGYTLIEGHFFLNRERITELFCINQDQPSLQCEGQCELGKRLSAAREAEEGEREIQLNELNMTYFFEPAVLLPEIAITLLPSFIAVPLIGGEGMDLRFRFFHPPQV